MNKLVITLAYVFLFIELLLNNSEIKKKYCYFLQQNGTMML